MADEKHVAIVRLDCLRLAHYAGKPADEVLADAEKYLKFVMPPITVQRTVNNSGADEIPF